MPRLLRSLLFVTLALLAPSLTHAAPAIDLRQASIVVPKEQAPLERRAVEILREEVRERSGIDLPVADHWTEGTGPVIALGLGSQANQYAGPGAPGFEEAAAKLGPEGFALLVSATERPTILLAGADARGLLYGVGRLLRKSSLAPGEFTLPADLHVVTTPKYPLRGHQLGYRPKVNAYDAWSVEQYDRYIRDLALFGSNSIELMPPRTDDKPSSPHMKVAPLEMLVRVDEVIASYGLDVWLWYPNMGKDYVSEKGIAAELAERDEVFSKLKRVDHILVPGGDPGNLEPDVLFPWLEKMAQVLRKHHPKAKIWVSPQAFEPTKQWVDSFFAQLNKKPDWLGGSCFAPWEPVTIDELRRRTDPALPVRNYPDITHNVDCQYPVPNWDLAFAITLHRECYNPRPRAMKTIQNVFADRMCGSLTYSEGIADDVNKFVWGDQDWDPNTQVIDTLRDYARLFIDPHHADDIAQGLLALEQNWVGPVAVNPQIGVTLDLWQGLEQALPQRARESYRFRMPLLRAHYDAYIQRRLIHETDLERQAREALSSGNDMLAAIDRAEAILAGPQSQPVGVELKAKCIELADILFHQIGWQTSVARHQAQHRTRGAFLDGIDEPLNDVAWLGAQFRDIRKLGSEPERRAAIERVLHRTDPGPGGFYDNLGVPGTASRIVNDVAWATDPGTLNSPRVTFYYIIDRPQDKEIPLAWKKQACTLYGLPLRLVYEDLDPTAHYAVRASYSGRESRLMRLVANEKHVVAEQIEPKQAIEQEFPIPVEATRSGRLELSWSCGERQRSTEVAEVWLIKLPSAK